MQDLDFYNNYIRIVDDAKQRNKTNDKNHEYENWEKDALSIIDLLGYDVSNPHIVERKKVKLAKFTHNSDTHELETEYKDTSFLVVRKDGMRIFAICNTMSDLFEYFPLHGNFDRNLNPFKYLKVRIIIYVSSMLFGFSISKKNFEPFKMRTNLWTLTIPIINSRDRTKKYAASIHLLSLLHKSKFEEEETCRKLLTGITKLNYVRAIENVSLNNPLLCGKVIFGEAWPEEDKELRQILSNYREQLMQLISYDDIFEL